MNAPDFTLDAYRSLVQTLLDSKYEAVSFHDADPSQKHLILRHDLDFSLEAALPLGEVEAGLGCQATYFVLVRSNMYNIHTPDAAAAFQTLQALGHEIGLHLDASQYGEDIATLEDAAVRECRWLEDMTGQPVRSVSFHRPAKALLDVDSTLAGRIHAYQAKFFRQMGYCSDSRGAWHHGHPLEHPAVVAGTALQLLTHPIWWTSRFPGDPVSTLDEFREDLDQRAMKSLEANCEPYRARPERKS